MVQQAQMKQEQYEKNLKVQNDEFVHFYFIVDVSKRSR